MINSQALLTDLQRLLPRLELDIREHAETVPGAIQSLELAHQEAQAADRTAQSFIDYRDAQITQAAVAWVLSSVFVRFLEDNNLLQPMLSGPTGDALQQAKGQLEVYFREDPTRNDRDYLLYVFEQLQPYPVMKALLDPAHNPLWQLQLSADGAKTLLSFFQRIDPESGETVHDFTDPNWDTRFLGDLYQDLSASVRKRYALLQTPEFVEDFILKYTLDKAVDAFPLSEVRLIDPTCGSGHFVLGAFSRLFNLWQAREPETNTRVLAERALQAVHGVDINPYAVAIARFRLLIAAMRVADCSTISKAPAFPFNLAVGDSLLHGKRHESEGQGIQTDMHDDPIGHVFATEDGAALARILNQQYHAVVGNPPYIPVKDKALNASYRVKYPTCFRKYSLGVPFTERFFDLTLSDDGVWPAGFVGMITASSFTRRVFGKKLIEEYLPRKDLTYVIDTSRAYIPGHGTSTVILFGRNRTPITKSMRTVLSIRGEPHTPLEPARGLVWRAIVDQLEKPGSESDFVSVLDQPRESYGKHPWGLSGGGAGDLKELIDSDHRSLNSYIEVVGFGAILGEDDAFAVPSDKVHAINFPCDNRPLVEGKKVRDWGLDSNVTVVFPYDNSIGLNVTSETTRWFWPLRTTLWGRTTFAKKTFRDAGKNYSEYHQIPVERNKTPRCITFAEVASHNHFVFNREVRLFNQTAPVIKLRDGASEAEHLVLLGLLNSSTACFWIKQVFYPKGGDPAGGKGARLSKNVWDDRFQLAGSGLRKYPIVEDTSGHLLSLASKINSLAQNCEENTPIKSLENESINPVHVLAEASVKNSDLACKMIAQHEELDWLNYQLYGLTDEILYTDEPPPIVLGQRAFEIILARQIAQGETQTTWFERHGSKPITELPSNWPADYKALVERRLQAIADNRWIALVEQPEYKRRWNTEPWAKRQQRALKEWLLDHLEQHCNELQLQTAAQLTERVRHGERFQKIASLYCDTSDFDVQALVSNLVAGDNVPAMAAARYKPKGVEKYRAWQDTWDMQRHEDAIDARCERPETDPQHLTAAEATALKSKEVGDIPLPPKYVKTDFLKGEYWPLRGKLDVPKERFFSLPGAERDGDSTLVFGWAGLNHLQRATAIATWYLERREKDGWQGEQLLPMLVALHELLPWLLQWHNEMDLEYGERMGDYYQNFLLEQLRELNLSLDALNT